MNNKYILSHEDIEKAFRDAMNNGIPHGIECGVENIDDCFRLDRGKLVVATGIPNMGKSEFIDFLCVQYNKLYGMRTLFFSPENQPIYLHIDKLYRKFEGARFDKAKLDDARSVAVRRYIYDNFLFFNYGHEYNVEQVISIAEEQVYATGIDILVIDSHNKLLHDITQNETDVIGRELDKLERFAKRMNIIVILVAHPRKMERKGEEYVIPSAYDINGSANFYNKADYVFTVHRNYKPNYTTVRVDKVKFNNYGGHGEISLGYNLVSGNYYDIPPMDDIFTRSNEVPPPPLETSFDLNAHTKSGDEWLNVSCSYSDKVFSSTVSECNLWWFLTHTNEELQGSLRKIRETEDKRVQQELKSRLLPIITPSVVVSGKRDSKHIQGYTNIICLDIDMKDNEAVMCKVPDILKSLPYVAMAQRSASGQGYSVFVPIKYGNSVLEHFLALEKEFANMGVVIDKSCKDDVRARYYSYDEQRYVNPSCSVYQRRLAASYSAKQPTYTVSATTPPQYSTPTYSSSDLIADLDRECSTVEGLNVCDTHQAWVEVGSALAKELGEQGRVYFHKLSQGHPHYNPSETNSKFDELLPRADGYRYNKGTIFHYIKKARVV